MRASIRVQRDRASARRAVRCRCCALLIVQQLHALIVDTQRAADAGRAARCRCWTRSALPIVQQLHALIIDAQRAADAGRTTARSAARSSSMRASIRVQRDRASARRAARRAARPAAARALIRIAHLWLYFLVHRWLVFRANTTKPPRHCGGFDQARRRDQRRGRCTLCSYNSTSICVRSAACARIATFSYTRSRFVIMLRF